MSLKLQKKIIKQMKEMNIYNKGFNDIIKIHADLLHQYDIFQTQFISDNFNVTEAYTNNKGGESERKTPLYLALETLRKDILSYSSQLGLNPKALMNVSGDLQQSQKESLLAKVMSDI